jgi:hypothetical protein
MIQAVSAASIFAGVCAVAIVVEKTTVVMAAIAVAMRREGVVMVVSPV